MVRIVIEEGLQRQLHAEGTQDHRRIHIACVHFGVPDAAVVAPFGGGGMGWWWGGGVVFKNPNYV